MFLVRLIYVSAISEQFQVEDIDDILETARKNNQSNDVSGLLCFNRKYFLQCLEVSRTAVNKTYAHILNDKRHENSLLLDYQEIPKREFPNWSMGYIPESALTDQINLLYSGNRTFSPYEMSGESCHGLLSELSDVLLTTE